MSDTNTMTGAMHENAPGAAQPAWATDPSHPLNAIELQARQMAEAALQDWDDEATIDEAAVGYYRGIFDRLRHEAMVAAVRPTVQLKARLMLPFVAPMVATSGRPVRGFRSKIPPNIAEAIAEADRLIEATKLTYYPELAAKTVPQP